MADASMLKAVSNLDQDKSVGPLVVLRLKKPLCSKIGFKFKTSTLQAKPTQSAPIQASRRLKHRGIGVLAFAFIVLAGCGDQKVVPFLGQWPGQFTVDKVNKGPDGPEDRKHHTLHGYLSVRLNKKSYMLHLEGEQQQIDVKGTWTYSGNQLTLTPVDPKINTEGGKEGLNPNFKFVPVDELYLAYEKKMTLNLSKDRATLLGLRTSVAFLEGTHSFKKD